MKNLLNAIISKLDLIDATVKVYDDIFFFFFHLPKSLAPVKLIEFIQKNITYFAEWDENYILTGVYDLQKNDLRKYLKN